MSQAPPTAEPQINLPRLNKTSASDYCRAVQKSSMVEFWWYMGGLVSKPSRWKPFEDEAGRWWWHVKPYFAWPVDFFSAMSTPQKVRPPGRLLGWQFPVEERLANSRVRINAIRDLAGYCLEGIEGKKRRWTIRKALRELEYRVIDPADAGMAQRACEVWNSHVERTGWNRKMSVPQFQASWGELATMPGTTVIAAFEPGTGTMCAWLIGRVIDDTAFIDTLTSHTDRVGSGPNDGLVFLYLSAAASMGVRHAHYGLHSKIESLESFKQGLGFHPHPFPAYLHLRFPVGPLLRMLRPRDYKRLLGDEFWSA